MVRMPAPMGADHRGQPDPLAFLFFLRRQHQPRRSVSEQWVGRLALMTEGRVFTYFCNDFIISDLISRKLNQF